MRDLLGVTAVDGQLPSEGLVDDFDGPITPDAWRLYQQVAGKVASQVMSGANKSKFITCDPATTDCLKKTIETFGRKAFRRKLTADEVTRFQTLSKTTPPGTPAEVAQATLETFLVSPSFLMVPEFNETPEGTAIKLSSYEVATRLAFLLWGSLPDDTLNVAADADQLQTKAQILTQAQRMIAVREKTGALISTFHRDWIQMNNQGGHWWKIDHDPKFSAYTPAAKVTFQAELDKFFEEIAFSNGKFKDLFLSKLAFVNKDNAAIYGLDPGMYTSQLTKQEIGTDAQPRPGFMTRAGFLSSYSSYDASSPILRGAFMTVWMLGVNPGAPNPEFAKATVDGTFTTQREYIEALTMRSDPCKGCHEVVNPSGFAMENYDSIGKWQATDQRGGAINAVATVNFGSGVKKEISSPVQLMQEIANTPKSKQIYSQTWVHYAFGRPANVNDQCIVDSLNANLAKDDYPIVNVLADLTQADSFRLRVQETP